MESIAFLLTSSGTIIWNLQYWWLEIQKYVYEDSLVVEFTSDVSPRYVIMKVLRSCSYYLFFT